MDHISEELLKKNVSSYLELNDSLKTLRKRAKEFRDQKDVLEVEIVRLMKDNQVPILNLPNGKHIELKTKESKKNKSSKWVKEQLNKCKLIESADASKEMLVNIIHEIESVPVVTVDKIHCK
jgi:hypothetical protein